MLNFSGVLVEDSIGIPPSLVCRSSKCEETSKNPRTSMHVGPTNKMGSQGLGDTSKTARGPRGINIGGLLNVLSKYISLLALQQ